MSIVYSEAAALPDALEALASGSRPVAGGTDLVVGARHGKSPLPESLVAIHRLAELRGITDRDGALRLAAVVSHAEIVADSRVLKHYTALADASAIVGSHATRHVGTIGGNVMNASPAMETGGPLICFGAEAVLASTGGERRVSVADLLVGPGRTSARPDELLVAIDLPLPVAGTASCYVRLEYRRQMEIAVVGVTAVVTLDAGCVTDARVAITALAPTIHRVPDAEAALVGSDGGDGAVQAAADAAAAAAQPISDLRGSADYRRAMAAVIAGRAISSALARARGETVPVPASPALHGA
jgi:CO/xanthine dehydrogenase FAD-binding subunit